MPATHAGVFPPEFNVRPVFSLRNNVSVVQTRPDHLEAR